MKTKSSANSKMLEVVDICSRFSQMNIAGKQSLLSDLLDMCDARLLAYVHEFATPRLKRDPLIVLPNELCLRVGDSSWFLLFVAAWACNYIEPFLTKFIFQYADTFIRRRSTLAGSSFAGLKTVARCDAR